MPETDLEQTDTNGVPVDHELGDPSSDLQAPDPLLGESAAGTGALSKVGTKGYSQERASESLGELNRLKGQYGRIQGQLGGAYGEQIQAMKDATGRILQMNMAPSDKEQALRVASAMARGNATGGYDTAGVAGTQADVLSQVRAAELQKQQLLAQYGTQIPAALINQLNAQSNALTGQMRIAAGIYKGDEGAASKAATAAPKAMTNGTFWNPNKQNADGSMGAFDFDPKIAAAQEALVATNEKAKQAAKLAAMQLNAGSMDPRIIKLAADSYRTTGALPPGMTPRMTNGMINPVVTAIYKQALDDAHTDGDTNTELLAGSALGNASSSVLRDFESGPTSKALNGLNTSIKHTQVLNPLIDSLDNTNFTAGNQVKNWFATNMQGNPAPNNFDGVRDFVVGEIAKAVLPGGGGEQERQALAKTAQAAGSPAVLKDIVRQWYTLLAGKTDATRLQWNTGTMGADSKPRFGDFDSKFLLPETRAALAIIHPRAQQAPAPQQQAAAQNPMVAYYLAVAKAKAAGQQPPPMPPGMAPRPPQAAAAPSAPPAPPVAAPPMVKPPGSP